MNSSLNSSLRRYLLMLSGVLLLFSTPWEGVPISISMLALPAMVLSILLGPKHRSIALNIPLIIATLSLVSSSFFSSLIAGYYQTSHLTSIVYTSLYFLFFLIGVFFYDSELEYIKKGILISAVVASAYVVYIFLSRGIYRYGISVFYVSNLRLWGREFGIPGWPTGFAIITGISMFFSMQYKGRTRTIAIFLLVIAGILSTSRSFLVFLVFFVLSRLPSPRKKRFLAYCFISVLLFVAATIFFLEGNESLRFRLLKFSDRETIYSYSFSLFFDRPFLGHGSVSSKFIFEDLLAYSQAHNAFLDILIRQGLLGFVLYLMIFLSIKWRTIYRSNRYDFYLLFAIIVSSLFQLALKNFNVIIVFSLLGFVRRAD